MKLHPLSFLRIMGVLDGISLLTLLFIAMPLKYIWHYPVAVSINGALHGGIFLIYVFAIVVVQLRLQWQVWWSLICVLVAFIPFGNFVLEAKLKKMQPHLHSKPFPKKWLLYAIIFFSFFDLFIQLPIMSTYAISLGATAFIAGIVVGLYSFTNTFGNVLSGVLTDKIGANYIVITGLVLSVLSLASYQLVNDPTTLLIVRCLHGFSSGLITPAAFALLANVMKTETQGSSSAITGSFVGIAAIVGPATSGILSASMPIPNVLGIVAILGLILIVTFSLVMRKFVFQRPAKAEVKVERFEWTRGLALAYSGAFLLMFSQGCLSYLLPLYVSDLGYSSRMSGTLLSVFGIVAVLLFILPTNRVFDVLAPKVSLMIGIAIVGISQLLIGQLTTTTTLYGALALYGVGFTFIFPAINMLLLRGTKPETRGKAYGYFYAFFSLGVVVGSFTLGALNYTGTAGFTLTGALLMSYAALLTVIKHK